MCTSNLVDHLEAANPLSNRVRVILENETRGMIHLSIALCRFSVGSFERNLNIVKFSQPVPKRIEAFSVSSMGIQM